MYVELHARSAFSFLEGASLPETLIGRAAELGYPALALLDRDGVYGAPRFYLAAKKAGVRAHIGAEITLAAGGRLPLLARSRDGYHNLCRLITASKLRAPKGGAAIVDSDLAAHACGLVCLTGGADGPLSLALGKGFDEAVRLVERLAVAFGRENVYVEVERHFDRAEEARVRAAVEIARRLRLPLLACNGVRHASPSDRPILDLLTCVRAHRTIETAGRLLAKNAERFLKEPRQMEALFADLPEAARATSELSARLEFELGDLGYEFPKYPVPEGETIEAMMSFLRKRVDEGARERYRPYHERARRQICRELDLICKLELAGYFLIVWDIVQFCLQHDILVQGRGSAANSAVCYALGITAVDPVGMDLLFERFLSEERGEWPDIDLDLPSGDRRERAIQYVYERYGRLGAAMTANVITYRGRSAAREVGKALGFDPPTLDRLSALVHGWEWHDPSYTPERQFRDAGLDLEHPRIRSFLRYFQLVQDLPRHLGQHSGGMVICQGELGSIVPLEPATMPGRVVVQWDKDDCADMGILKVDLLGLGMMSVLQDTLGLIRESYGEEVTLAHLPEDPEVYEALGRADTIGMFQVESRAQMACLPRLRPRTFYDLVVQVAIIRPGPIVGKMVHPYLKRRQGREPADCLHPKLEPVLRRTLGVPLFQEQLLRMAMICAGFTGGEAEELRRAFGFKRAEARMADVEVKLRRGMECNGITGPTQDAIVRSITSFALYGFPESHAASFALLAYASAYLKTRYLAAFTTAMLNNQPMGFYHPATIVKDAARHGLKLRPIDVARSEWDCTIEDDGEGKRVRLGLRYVKGLRESAARALVRARVERPFEGIDDLMRRVPELQKPEITRLAETGALNFLDAERGSVTRRDALWQIELRHVAGPLLEKLPAAEGGSPLVPMNDEERLAADFRSTSLTLGRHPMAFRRAALDRCKVVRAADLAALPNGRQVRVAGCVIVRQRPGTAKGFLFLSLEDETGIANIIVTPDLFDASRTVLVEQPFLLIDGIVQNQENVIAVKARRVEVLGLARTAPSHDFH